MTSFRHAYWRSRGSPVSSQPTRLHGHVECQGRLAAADVKRVVKSGTKDLFWFDVCRKSWPRSFSGMGPVWPVNTNNGFKVNDIVPSLFTFSPSQPAVLCRRSGSHSLCVSSAPSSQYQFSFKKLRVSVSFFFPQANPLFCLLVYVSPSCVSSASCLNLWRFSLDFLLKSTVSLFRSFSPSQPVVLFRRLC